MKITLNIGKEATELYIPDENLLAVLKPKHIKTSLTGANSVRDALENPIGKPHLKDIVKAGETVCIVTSDITRPMPTKQVLPIVLEKLYGAGIDKKDITVVFALGNHRSHTEEEMKYLAGDAYRDVRFVDSNQENMITIGRTSLGTPVDVFDEVAKADRIICLGNIEYHYFAGYSGGAKAIMPGVSTARAIQANHSRMVEETSVTGAIEGNRVRQDIEEAGAMVKIDFIVNVVLNEKKEIVKTIAGDYILAHREGCAFLDQIYKVPIEKKADIVIVSPGGFPKDINLYQAQKALDNSKHAVKDNGIIILAAACNEGLGEDVFERWMTEAESPASMVKKIKQKFELGGHKAAAIGMVQQKADVYLVSEMDDDFVKSMFFYPFASVKDALVSAMKKKGLNAKIIVMPYGGSTLPVVG